MFLKGFFTALGVIAVFVVIAIITALPVMWLWNNCMPEMFGLKEIGFKTALCFSILCSLLFKSSSSSNN